MVKKDKGKKKQKFIKFPLDKIESRVEEPDHVNNQEAVGVPRKSVEEEEPASSGEVCQQISESSNIQTINCPDDSEEQTVSSTTENVDDESDKIPLDLNVLKPLVDEKDENECTDKPDRKTFQSRTFKNKKNIRRENDSKTDTLEGNNRHNKNGLKEDRFDDNRKGQNQNRFDDSDSSKNDNYYHRNKNDMSSQNATSNLCQQSNVSQKDSGFKENVGHHFSHGCSASQEEAIDNQTSSKYINHEGNESPQDANSQNNNSNSHWPNSGLGSRTGRNYKKNRHNSDRQRGRDDNQTDDSNAGTVESQKDTQYEQGHEPYQDQQRPKPQKGRNNHQTYDSKSVESQKYPPYKQVHGPYHERSESQKRRNDKQSDEHRSKRFESQRESHYKGNARNHSDRERSQSQKRRNTKQSNEQYSKSKRVESEKDVDHWEGERSESQRKPYYKQTHRGNRDRERSDSQKGRNNKQTRGPYSDQERIESQKGPIEEPNTVRDGSGSQKGPNEKQRGGQYRNREKNMDYRERDSSKYESCNNRKFRQDKVERGQERGRGRSDHRNRRDDNQVGHNHANRGTGNSHHKRHFEQDTRYSTEYGNPQKYSNGKDEEDWDNECKGDDEKSQLHPAGDIKDVRENVEQDLDNAPTQEENWDVETTMPLPDLGTTYMDEKHQENGSKQSCQFSIVSPRSSTLNPEAASFHLSSPQSTNSWNEMFEQEQIKPSSEKEPVYPKESTEAREENFNTNKSIKSWPDDSKNNKYSSEKSNKSFRYGENKTGEYKKPQERRQNYSGVVSVGDTVFPQKSQSTRHSLDRLEKSDFNGRRSDISKGVDDTNNWRSRNYDKPRRSNDGYKYDWSNEGPTKSNRWSVEAALNKFTVQNDKEWEEFVNYLESKRDKKYVKVKEEDRDLFKTEENYALAHCVAEDMKMGSGIAVEFRRIFKRLPELLQQRQESGGLAILDHKSRRFIYYMVTKTFSSGKPTYATFWVSLKKLRGHMKTNQVKKLAIPTIGCGLDRLDWNKVKPMVEFLFRDMDVEILVCRFIQDDTITSATSSNAPKPCKIVHELYSISQIEAGTIILYFASTDGETTETMREIDGKFHHLLEFKRAKKILGETVRFDEKSYSFILYGCLVKERANDLFDFVQFEKCLNVIKKNNRKDGFAYVAFQKVSDEKDELLNEKILNIMSRSLRDVDIYCCNSVVRKDNSVDTDLNQISEDA